MATIHNAAPQLLVSDLGKSLAFYGERLGFRADFVYEGFYAAVSRDGATLHLKCAAQLEGERAHRRANEHLDAYLGVSGVRELHEELAGRGAPITRALESRPWGAVDFTVEDPDGHVLCFSQAG
jgi:catechol 2,3-dioxygenase-like lactoylglutathione lyase family enzyme